MTGVQLAGRRVAAAMTTDLAGRLSRHLHRDDGQEDLCFVLWRPSTGAVRTTAVVADAIWPGDGERLVCGNVSFTSDTSCALPPLPPMRGRVSASCTVTLAGAAGRA